MTHLPLRSEYLVMLDDVLIMDCCEMRKKELEKEWRVEVLAYAENLPNPSRHCGIGCINWERRKDG